MGYVIITDRATGRREILGDLPQEFTKPCAPGLESVRLAAANKRMRDFALKKLNLTDSGGEDHSFDHWNR